MSNQRFIELSSSYRNRTLYPNPAEFEVSFVANNTITHSETIRGVYNKTPIISSINSSQDTVINGVVEYLFQNLITTNSIFFDNSSGVVTLTNQATIPFTTINLINVPIIITDTQTNNIIGITTIISTITVGLYLIVTFSSLVPLLDGYLNYIYTSCLDMGTVSGGTNSTIIINSLMTPYSNVFNYYLGCQINLYTVGSPLLSSSTIRLYNPSVNTFFITESLSFLPVSTMYFTITVNSIVLPGIDLCGKTLLDYDQSYLNYYIVNESQSSGTSIISSRILSFSDISRLVTVESSFSYNIYDRFSIRRSLPNEFLTTISAPVYQGIVTNQINTTIYVSGLTSSANYNGFQIDINGYPQNIISSSSISNTELLLQDSLIIAGVPPFSIPFTITPIFKRVDPYQPISLQNCIFLPSTANRQDNYYTGRYIYIYPNQVTNNQITTLQNIKGSCLYIQSYIGNGYNACFVINVDTPEVISNTIYPSYTNTRLQSIQIGTSINIVSFYQNNAIPLNYTGSTVSQSQQVAYEISLLSLTLPNITLITGSNIAYYPYVYVEFTVTTQSSSQTIYSNNPKSNKAIFLIPIRDIRFKTQTPFIKLRSSMSQTVKFKPNDSLRFSVYLPDGKLFKTITTDYYSPSMPNPFIQINALFGINRIA
jgi:hypothetical protein